MTRADSAQIEERLIAQGRAMLSGPGRWGHVALLAAALAMAATLGSLLATEPGLPLRTTISFSVMLAMALAWVAYAVWVLAQRRPLFGRHRVVASSMGCGFAGLYTAGAVTLWLGADMPGAGPAAGLGVVMLAGGVLLLIRARRQVQALQAWRRRLEGGA
ncbi:MULTISPECIES: hypothetical protein [unclassified Azospirillum]|uniref:hypothetical protein n=1 Tax=unclassified Azospirillum TaxID=2630922 RepID=UPI000B62BFB1|nr:MULTISPECIES: hypothetical protein [unclassified Azospirillum]SNR87047.1 hypothetical protein SAMN05880556_101255 [Azospirillum sp. RU38E]SNS03263.1 hypothetical protein SAMN05880591_101255 [Azospirillum sp. RU37A]